VDYAREADFYQLPPQAIPLPLLLHARVLQAHEAAVEGMLAHLLVRGTPRAPGARRPARPRRAAAARCAPSSAARARQARTTAGHGDAAFLVCAKARAGCAAASGPALEVAAVPVSAGYPVGRAPLPGNIWSYGRDGEAAPPASVLAVLTERLERLSGARVAQAYKVRWGPGDRPPPPGAALTRTLPARPCHRSQRRRCAGRAGRALRGAVAGAGPALLGPPAQCAARLRSRAAAERGADSSVWRGPRSTTRSRCRCWR